MKLAVKIIFIFLICAISHKANCQEKADWELVTQSQNFKIQERALVILDHNLYLVGESINLFAATYDLALQIPIDFSSILYVELFNQNNQVVSAQKYLLNHGEVVNRLIIPKEVETGFYYIRAYTNYMKNFGASAFFTQRIKIINPFVSSNAQPEELLKPAVSQINVYPEGGKIISGIDNKIVFQCPQGTDQLHAALFENDSIIDETNTTDGFGVFNFKPSTSNNYRIEASLGNQKKYIFQIKDVVQSGVVCKLDSVIQDDVYIRVKTQAFNKMPLSISIHHNGMLYTQMNTLNNPDTCLKIKLPAGLNEITVKDNENIMVSERAVYIIQNSKCDISAQIVKPTILPGDSLSLQITTGSCDSIQYLVALNLSHVNNSNSFQAQMASSLFASSIASRTKHITLNEKPHILNDAKKINEYILTFPSNDNTRALNDNIHFLPEIRDDIITGSVSIKNSPLMACNKSIYMSFVDSICWVNRCETNSRSQFVCKLPLHYQGGDLVVSVLDTTEQYTVKIDDEFYPDFLKVEKEYYFPAPSLKEMIETRMVNLQVNDAYPHKSTNPQIARPSLRFYGTPSVEYQFRKYINLPNLEEFIFEIAIEATKVKKGTKVDFKIRSQSKTGNEDPLIILDGVPLFNTDNLATIPCSKLESIRMVSKQFFWGSAIYNGIIDITSIDKSLSLVDLSQNSKKFTFSQIITTNENHQLSDDRTPNYLTNVFFDVINSASGNAELKVKLPNNQGKYSLQLLGYKKTGEWGVVSMPDAINTSH